MILTALACPVFTSCYNDAALWDEIEGIHGDVESLEQKLAALEAKLNTDLQALQTLLESQISKLEGKVDALVTVKDVKENTDGSVTVILSDNTEFTVHPKFEQDYKGLVTTTTIDGVLYWAVFDENGKATVVTDKDGNLVPVVDVVRQVRVNPETALVEISFDGGNTWIEVGYNEPCVFESAEVVWTDNYTDEQETEYPEYYQETPMYVVITLPDGNTISLTIDDAASFLFGGHSGFQSTQYVECGKTASVSVLGTNITEWVKEVPAGWKVTESGAEYIADGGLEFNITAPTAEAVASGAALAEGELKVIAVAEGGKTVVSKLFLTTKPFKTFVAGGGKFTVETNYGIHGFIVGMSSLADFDAESITSQLKMVVESDPYWSPWYVDENDCPFDDNAFDSSLKDYSITDLKSVPQLVDGEKYVLWVVPYEQWVDYDTWESGTNLGSLVSTSYTHMYITFDEPVVKFNDIQIKAEFKGVEQYYGRFSSKYSDEVNWEGILSEMNSYIEWETLYTVNDEYKEGWDNGVFTGNPADLFDGTQAIQPNTGYYMYIIPYEEGKTKYSITDMYCMEFTTPALVPGSSITVTPGEVTATYTTIAVELEAKNSAFIYYAWVEESKVSTIADKTEYLLESGNLAAGSMTVARSNSNYNMTLKPGMSAVLIAMAVDENGAYGDIFEKTYSTNDVTFNDVKLELAIEGKITDVATVKVSVTGGEPTEYYYKHYTADNYTWLNTYGGTEESASQFFATTNYTWYFNTINALPEGGLIELSGIEYGKYVFVISSSTINEKGEKVFSKAKVLEFERSLELGTIVSAKDDNGNDNAAWVAAKPTVNYTLDSVGDDSSVTWTVSDLPEGWTGFTAIVDSEYTSSYASDKDLITFLVQNEYGFATKYELVNGESYSKHWLYTANYDLYVVIVDPDGNYYAPYKWNFDATAGGFGV